MRTMFQYFSIWAIFLFFGNCVFSQGSHGVSGLSKMTDYESQIRMVYGDDWMALNADAVTALEECFSNRVTYMQEELTANDKYPLLSSFPIMNRNNPSVTAIDYANFNPENFMPVTYNLPFFSDMKQVIRVDGTNYIIVIEPIKRN